MTSKATWWVVLLGVAVLGAAGCSSGGGGGDDAPTCEAFCAKAAECGTECVPEDCLTWCPENMSASDLSCADLATCGQFADCVCATDDDSDDDVFDDDDDTGGDDTGDDDTGDDDTGDDTGGDDTGDDTGDDDCSSNTPPDLLAAYYIVNGSEDTPPIVIDPYDEFGIYFEYNDDDCNLPGGQFWANLNDQGYEAFPDPLPEDLGCSTAESGIIYGFSMNNPMDSGYYTFEVYWTDVCDEPSNTLSGSWTVN